MSDNYLKGLFINEAKPALQRHAGGGSSLDHTVTFTFTVDNKPYEIVSVKDGNQINAPVNNPTSESGTFVGWQIEGKSVTFPYLPTNDIEMRAHFSRLSNILYDHFNVDKAVYPFILIDISGNSVWCVFAKDAYQGENQILYNNGLLAFGSCPINDKSNGKDVADAIVENFNSSSLETKNGNYRVGYSSSYITWSNRNFTTASTLYLFE